MKRLLRWAFNGLAALSLLLCVGVGALWIRSYRVCDEMDWRGEQRPFFIGEKVFQPTGYDGAWAYATRGTLWVVRYELNNSPLDPLPEHPGWDYRALPPFDADAWQWMPKKWEYMRRAFAGCDFYLPRWDVSSMGLAYRKRQYSYGNSFGDLDAVVLRLPLGCLATAMFSVLLILMTAKHVRARQRARAKIAGLCPACGYDLRATPDYCPECAAVPSPAKG